jgi:hypothetical protein
MLRRNRGMTLIKAVPYDVSRDTVPRGAISARITATRAGLSCNYSCQAHLAGALDRTTTTSCLTGTVNVCMVFLINA